MLGLFDVRDEIARSAAKPGVAETAKRNVAPVVTPPGT
jgi:hypothetical protein